jgi:hypothetical protein
VKLSPYDLDPKEARALARPAPPAPVELLVLSDRGIRFGVPGHYGLFEETPTFEAAVEIARRNLANGHACACVAIRIEAKLIDGIGDGTDCELVRFEVYPDRVTLVPRTQGNHPSSNA